MTDGLTTSKTRAGGLSGHSFSKAYIQLDFTGSVDQKAIHTTIKVPEEPEGVLDFGGVVCGPPVLARVWQCDA